MIKPTVTVTDTDRGQKAMVRRVAAMAGKKAVKIGLMGKAAQRKESGAVDNIQVGIFNEFGTSDGRVPERSFLRSTFDEKRPDYERLKEKLAGKIIDGAMEVDQALGLLGLKVQADVRAKIKAHIPPPNAPATIAAKKSSTPLVDTGQLVAAIQFAVE